MTEWKRVVRICRLLILLVFLWSLAAGYWGNSINSMVCFLVLLVPELFDVPATNRPVEIALKPFFVPKTIGVLALGLTAHTFLSTNSPLGHHLQFGWFDASFIPHFLLGAALYLFSLEIIKGVWDRTHWRGKNRAPYLAFAAVLLGGGAIEVFDGFVLGYHSLDCVSDEIWNCLGGLCAYRMK